MCTIIYDNMTSRIKKMAFGEMEATRSIKTEKEQSLKFGEECRETTYVFGFNVLNL